jgi:hypothetical protein
LTEDLKKVNDELAELASEEELWKKVDLLDVYETGLQKPVEQP